VVTQITRIGVGGNEPVRFPIRSPDLMRNLISRPRRAELDSLSPRVEEVEPSLSSCSRKVASRCGPQSSRGVLLLLKIPSSKQASLCGSFSDLSQSPCILLGYRPVYRLVIQDIALKQYGLVSVTRAVAVLFRVLPSKGEESLCRGFIS
jgi:hypothetical protein